MSLRTEFAMEWGLPPTEVTLTAIWYVEPASGDGYTEPRTPAYPVVECVMDSQENDLSNDMQVLNAAYSAVNAEYRQGCAVEVIDFDDD